MIFNHPPYSYIVNEAARSWIALYIFQCRDLSPNNPSYGLLLLLRQKCKRLCVELINIFLFKREILIPAFTPCGYAVVVIGACGVIRLAGTIDADERFIVPEVRDNAHFRNQPYIIIGTGMVGRNIESGVVAGCGIWTSVKV